MTKEYGHKVIRLPPYHCHFNSIELIWAQIEGRVARNNKKFSITEITKMTVKAIEQSTESNWKKVVDHTCKAVSYTHLDVYKRQVVGLPTEVLT